MATACCTGAGAGDGGGGGAGGSACVLAGALFDDRYDSRSCLVIRSPAPVPLIRLKSMLFSRAILRTSGESGPAVSSDHGRNRLRRRRRRNRSGAVEVARSGFRLRNSGQRRGRAGPIVDARHHRVDPHRLAFFNQNLGQRSSRRRRNFRIHFVRRNLEQRLVALRSFLPASSATWSVFLPQYFRPSGASRRQS